LQATTGTPVEVPVPRKVIFILLFSFGIEGVGGFRVSGFQGFKIQTGCNICSSGFSPTGRCPKDRGVFEDFNILGIYRIFEL